MLDGYPAYLGRLWIAQVFKQVAVCLYVPDAAKNHWHEEQWNENTMIIDMNDWYSLFCDFDSWSLPCQTGRGLLHVVLLQPLQLRR